MDRELARKLLAEFVGALTLIFIGAGSQVATSTGVLGGGVVAIALAHGLAIATMVSTVGHISGGHFNPAITIGALVTRKIQPRDAIAYVLSQLAGAASGAALLVWSVPESIWRPVALGTPTFARVSAPQAVLIEGVLTFFLVWVVFATAIDEEGSFGKIAGLAIGFVITMDILAGGAFTGAAMNPARAFGPALLSEFWRGHWVYWVGPIAGGLVAAALYELGVLAPAKRRPPRRRARGRR